MHPHLIVVAGPSRGSIIDIAEGQLSIGRLSSNQLHIPDPTISRKHCVVVREGDRVTLRDLNSSHGSFVGEVPIKERVLAHRDEVRLGDSVLWFLAESEGDRGPLVEEQPIATSTMTKLFPEDAVPLVRRTDHIRALMDLTRGLMAIRDPELVAHELLKSVSSVAQADCGAVYLDQPHRPLHEAAAAPPGQPVPVDLQIAEDVVRSGRAHMTNDIVGRHGGSVLCAPLSALDRVLGVIYVMRTTPPFDGDDLRFVTAAASMAGMTLHSARHLRSLKREAERLRAEDRRRRHFVGESRALRIVEENIAKLAASDSTVLIYGETGTGKELAARLIHERGARAHAAFIAINCAAFPKDLVENELFGHRKGGFTGATDDQIGLLEAGHRGTVFFDEIGEMPLELQPKLLRVLQEHEFRPVGATKTVEVDIRVIAATNRDLKRAVAEGTFREDLCYRLGISMTMPPLREHREDIKLLAQYFLRLCSAQCGRSVKQIGANALEALMAYDWPGNVRELENAIERAVVMGSSTELAFEDLPEEVREVAPDSAQQGEYDKAVLHAKRDVVERALELFDYDYAAAAKWLDIHVNALHRLIRNLGIKKKTPRRT